MSRTAKRAALEPRVTNWLKRNPGLTAEELAKDLRVLKRDVNSVLYGSPTFESDDSSRPRWRTTTTEVGEAATRGKPPPFDSHSRHLTPWRLVNPTTASEMMSTDKAFLDVAQTLFLAGSTFLVPATDQSPSTPVEHLGLPFGSDHLLTRQGITTVRELLLVSPADLMKTYGLEARVAAPVVLHLALNGLTPSAFLDETTLDIGRVSRLTVRATLEACSREAQFLEVADRIYFDDRRFGSSVTLPDMVTSVSELRVTTRTLRSLQTAGLDVLDDLRAVPPSELSQLHNFGHTSLLDLLTRLSVYQARPERSIEHLVEHAQSELRESSRALRDLTFLLMLRGVGPNEIAERAGIEVESVLSAASEVLTERDREPVLNGRASRLARKRAQTRRPSTGNRSHARAMEMVAMRANGSTLAEIGEKFGVSRERARQILKSYSTQVESQVESQLEKTMTALLSGLSAGDNLVDIAERLGSELAELEALLKPDTNDLAPHRRAQQEHGLAVAKERVTAFLCENPGSTLQEVAEATGWSTAFIQRAVPSLVRRLTVPEETDGRAGSKKVWSDAQILEAIRHAATYEYPITTNHFEHLRSIGEISAPSVPLIHMRFGGWRAACEAAGVESGETLRDSYESRWTDADLLRFAGQFLADGSSDGTLSGFTAWLAQDADRPSGPTMRNRLGGWSDIKRAALTADGFKDMLRKQR